VEEALDPELAVAGAAMPAMDLSDVAATRELGRLMMSHLPRYESQLPLSVQDVTVPGSGASVQVRIYAPAQRPDRLPGLLYLHSGGYVMGGLATADSPAMLLAERAGVIVVVVDYRLAPEHPYPAGLEDCYTVLEWAAAHGSEHGIDPNRIAVLGESSGGGLAAALTLLSRDRRGPSLTAQFLDAPTIDDRLGTPSMKSVNAPTWQAANTIFSWRYYLNGTAEPGTPEVPLYAAPARATVRDLAGLPPAFVTLYQIDPFRDEGLDYARLLTQADVPTEIRQYSRAYHMAHIVPGTAIGARMTADRIDAIQRMLLP
jgi:acetyl esterase